MTLECTLMSSMKVERPRHVGDSPSLRRVCLVSLRKCFEVVSRNCFAFCKTHSNLAVVRQFMCSPFLSMRTLSSISNPRCFFQTSQTRIFSFYPPRAWVLCQLQLDSASWCATLLLLDDDNEWRLASNLLIVIVAVRSLSATRVRVDLPRRFIWL